MGRARRAPAGKGALGGVPGPGRPNPGLAGGPEPAPAEAATEIAEGGDLLLGLGTENRWIDADADSVGFGLVVVDPVQGVFAADLGVELERPGTLADAATLEADLAAGEGDGIGRQRELVAVPLEGLEGRGEGSEQGVVLSLGRDFHLVPADLRPRG